MDIEQTICVLCGESVDRDTEEYSVLYGDKGELVGYLHEKCSQEIEASGTVENYKVQ
jgi:hypothetical protein